MKGRENKEGGVMMIKGMVEEVREGVEDEDRGGGEVEQILPPTKHHDNSSSKRRSSECVRLGIEAMGEK